MIEYRLWRVPNKREWFANNTTTDANGGDGIIGERTTRENDSTAVTEANDKGDGSCIMRFGDVRARALSGGDEAEVDWNPPLLLLDEPSTSQDVGAKRNLWRVLKRVRGDRATLLTTHSMEEAEALASNVAIMRTKLLVSGTLSPLIDTYGGAYRLRGVRCATVSSDIAKSVVGKIFAYMDLHAMNYVGCILSAMEALKVCSGSGRTEAAMQAKVVEDYTLTELVLEELSMNAVTEA
ncbi:hypothetical protein BBP40_003290 [Aspergillus hancockii]|nr:hypothetical protein BBP40_003290 [Aspergillus hancockii]